MAQRFSNVLSLQVKPHKLLPCKIRAATSYEAGICCWEHHKSIYVQPLSEDCDREREALIGLVIAKGMPLLSPAHKLLRSPQLPHHMPSPLPFMAPLTPVGTRHRHNSNDVPHCQPPLQRPIMMHVLPTTHMSQPIHACVLAHPHIWTSPPCPRPPLTHLAPTSAYMCGPHASHVPCTIHTPQATPCA